MRKVLADVAENGGLPGDHHFTITFRTKAPGVKISRRLAEQWPHEMTIILQHQFSNLIVDETGFGVTLSFRFIPEQLYIPFEAVSVFSDPSVEFGLKFELAEEEAEEDKPRPGPQLVREDAGVEAFPQPAAKAAPDKLEQPAADKPAVGGEKASETPSDADKIVSIDAFRKKT